MTVTVGIVVSVRDLAGGVSSKSASWKTTSKKDEESASFWEKGESMSSRK